MTDTTRTNPKATAAPRSTDNTRTERNEHDPRPEAVHSNPRPGEFQAGSDNARLADYPKENAGSPGTKWSTKNIVIGLGVAVLVIVVLMMVF